MNSWTQRKSEPWEESSIKLLLSICSMSPANILIDIKKNEKAWNPKGDDIQGPARISYTQIYDDITVHVDRKEKPSKSKKIVKRS